MHSCLFYVFLVFSASVVKPRHFVEVLALLYVPFELLDLLHLVHIPLFCVDHLIFALGLCFTHVDQLRSVLD